MNESQEELKKKYEKIAGKTKRHHWVPQMHLRSFSPEGEEGRVFMYEAENEPVLVSTSDVAVTKDLYTFREKDEQKKTRVFEGIFSEHEGEVAQVMCNIKETECIPDSEEDRSHIAAFVSMLRVRGPAFSDWLRNMEAAHLDLLMQTYTEHPDIFREKLKESEIEFGSEDEFNEFLEFVKDPTKSKTKMTGGEEHYFKQAMEISKDLYNVLMTQKSWHVLIAPEKRHFITSDNPVVIQEPEGCPPHLAGGFLNGTVLLTISPKLCLAFRRIPMRHGKIQLNRADVDHVNKSIAQAARRQIYSHISSKDIVILCRAALTGNESEVSFQRLTKFSPYFVSVQKEQFMEADGIKNQSLSIEEL